LKFAVTVRATFISSVQVLFFPEQAPLQPLKLDLLAGVAVRITDVPVLKSVVQSVPQLIPAGALVTVPVPVPALLTVNE